MNDLTFSVNQHYGHESINKRILKAFEQAKIPAGEVTLDDLSKFDQLHYGGREATRLLAKMAGIKSGMEVLDIGSGLGGPARILAAEFGCKVVGVDLTIEFVTAARMLTDMVGLGESVTFLEGDALKLDFEEGRFDAVITQNAIMNIEEKKQFIMEAYRVLKRDGLLALAAIMAGPNDVSHYPLFWADTPVVNHLETPQNFQKMMAEVGFTELQWVDNTLYSIDAGRKQVATFQKKSPALGGHIFVKNVREKAQNTLHGLESGAFVDIQAIYKRDSRFYGGG